jgi:hypothetical protein
MRTIDCGVLVDLAPELAVGNLCGDERAAAIAHLAECASCQQVVTSFTTVADRLLLLAPRAEPPAGFEQRVLAALPADAAPRRRLPRVRRRWAPVLAAAALALAFFTGGMLLDLGSDGDPAFAGANMRTASGEVVGRVVVHDDPATLAMTLPGWAEEVERRGLSEAGYLVRIETDDGQTATRPVALAADATWVTPLDALDIEPEAVASVALVGPDGYVWCRAALG